MGSGVEVRFEYGGMTLTCSDEAFARVLDHLCNEPSVADALGGPPTIDRVRAIRVVQPVPPGEAAGPRFRWYEVATLVLVVCIQVPIVVTGIVTALRWLMSLIA